MDNTSATPLSWRPSLQDSCCRGSTEESRSSPKVIQVVITDPFFPETAFSNARMRSMKGTAAQSAHRAPVAKMQSKGPASVSLQGAALGPVPRHRHRQRIVTNTIIAARLLPRATLAAAKRPSETTAPPHAVPGLGAWQNLPYSSPKSLPLYTKLRRGGPSSPSAGLSTLARRVGENVV